MNTSTHDVLRANKRATRKVSLSPRKRSIDPTVDPTAHKPGPCAIGEQFSFDTWAPVGTGGRRRAMGLGDGLGAMNLGSERWTWARSDEPGLGAMDPGDGPGQWTRAMDPGNGPGRWTRAMDITTKLVISK